jgi:large repetitive protein
MTTRDRCCAGVLRLVLVAACAALVGCSDCDLSVSTTTLPNGIVGVPYAANLSSHCGGDVWFTNDSLPPGINLNSDGELRGVPSVVGLFSFTVGVFDFGSGQTAYGGLALRVDRAEPTPTPTPIALDRRAAGAVP